MLKFIHAADFHLDSAFGALPARQAAARRRECRETLFRLADYVNREGVQLVLLAGDLFDSIGAFRETGEQLAQALGKMAARVFIAPGNHDCVTDGSPWRTVEWPENVYIFRENRMTAAEVPELGVTPRRTASSTSGSSTESWSPPKPGTTPSAGRRSPPAALRTWLWAISTSGRSP